MSEKIIDVPLTEIASECFVEYAEEVNANRALPDCRDGLKPVQRKIIYAMSEMNLTNDKPYKKSARIVGDTMGKYHPHGDSSIYDAMARMAQGFSLRYPIIDGHGNFGSLNDPPAAMRYTEARMSKIAEEMLNYINKDTIEWGTNFDDSLKEPKILPSIFPNLLVNGSSGIAVGFACNIPPHNLCEVIDGICAYIKDPNIDTKGLLKHIKGPDFPSGGIISTENLFNCYNDSDDGINHKIKLRGKLGLEVLSDNKKQIVITELPYQVSTNKLTVKIADLLLGVNGEYNGIEDIRDESDLSGPRIVIEINEDSDEQKLIKDLYNKTNLQVNFSYNINVIVDGKIKSLNLKGMIENYVKHKKEVIENRIRYDLTLAKSRGHILEALIKAADIIDILIKEIRSCKTPKEAKIKIINNHKFSEKQAQAILDIKLQKLTSLEIKELKAEHKTIMTLIKEYEKTLSSEKNIEKELAKELVRIKELYGDERRTKIVDDFDQIVIKSKTENFTLQASNNKLKKLSERYNGNKELILKTDSSKTIFLFTNLGNIYKFNGTDIPSSIPEDVVYMCNSMDHKEDDNVTFVTTDGQIKRNLFGEYAEMKKITKTIKLNNQGKVLSVYIGNDLMDVLIITKMGLAIRFNTAESVRPMGKIAGGVRAIKLLEKDSVVYADFLGEGEGKGAYQINLQPDGFKKVDLNKVKIQNRDGKGVRLLGRITSIESVNKL